MIVVHLDKLQFYSFHGVHDEERIVGGRFELNVTVGYVPEQAVIQHIGDTVNYVLLYEIIKIRMATPTPLLETIAMDLAEMFLAQFSLIREVEINIIKLQPPIVSFQGNVGITYYKKRNH